MENNWNDLDTLNRMLKGKQKALEEFITRKGLELRKPETNLGDGEVLAIYDRIIGQLKVEIQEMIIHKTKKDEALKND